MKWREFFFWLMLIIRASAGVIIGGVGYVLHIVGGAIIFAGIYVGGPVMDNFFSLGEGEGESRAG